MTHNFPSVFVQESLIKVGCSTILCLFQLCYAQVGTLGSFFRPLKYHFFHQNHCIRNYTKRILERIFFFQHPSRLVFFLGISCTTQECDEQNFPWCIKGSVFLSCSAPWRLELMRRSFYVNVRHVAITSHNGIVMAISTTWFLCFCDVAACFILWVFSYVWLNPSIAILGLGTCI